MNRRFGLMLLAAALCLMLAGCGQSSQPSSQEPPVQSGQTDPSGSGEAETADPAGEEAPEEAPQEDAAGEEVAPAYADNFDVDAEAAADFARKIQEVVADQDLEALADLMMFPNYVGFTEDPAFVNTREEFTALGADRIFTQEMCDQIAAAETEDLQPSEAGFVLSADGRPNIIFGVYEGHLAIVGMNY